MRFRIPWYSVVIAALLFSRGTWAQETPDPMEQPAETAVAPAAEPVAADFIPLERESGAATGIEQTDENLINVSVENESLENVVNMFTRISGANIVATSADLEGTVTVSLKNVAWKPALGSILEVHNLALVEKIPGSSVFSIVPKPSADTAPLVVESIFLNYTTVTEMSPIVKSMLPAVTNVSIQIFASRNAMVVRTTESNVEEIRQLVKKMDVPAKQVCVETQFMELNDEAGKKLGIRWDSLDEFGIKFTPGPDGLAQWNRDIERVKGRENQYNNANSYSRTASSAENRTSAKEVEELFRDNGAQFEDVEPSFIEAPPGSGNYALLEKVVPTSVGSSSSTRSSDRNTSSSFSEGGSYSEFDTFLKTITESQAAILEAGDFGVVLSALKKTDGVKIVSNPKIIVASGSDDAFFSVGEREPIVKTEIQRGTQDSPGDILVAELDTAVNTDYIKNGYLETGIKLQVVPVVKTEEMIEAFIEPRLVRRILPDKVVGENSWPRLAVKEIRTKFTLRSGQTVAIGGLTDTSDRKKVSRVPLLGDIPLIGKYVFSHTDEVESQIETIIFVTLSLAEPDTLYREVGIPERARLVHTEMLENKSRRAKFEQELQQLREATEEEAAAGAKNRLLQRQR